VENTRLEGYSTSADLEGEQLGCVTVEGCPTQVIKPVAQEDGDEDADCVALAAVGCVFL
jgi:hypothetical protein